MQKFVIAVAALFALAFTVPAFAITQNNSTTVTKPDEIATGTVTISQTTPTGGTVEKKINLTSKTTRTNTKIETTQPVRVTTELTRKDGKTEKSTISIEPGRFSGTINLSGGLTMQVTPVTAQRPSVPAQSIPGDAGRAGGLFGHPTEPIENQFPDAKPSGFYFGIFPGWANASSDFTPVLYSSIGQAEPTQRIGRGASDNSFTLGGSFGYGFTGTPVALEAQLTWLNNEATILGLPGNQFPATANDTITVKKDWLASLSALYHFENIVPNGTAFAKVGVAAVHEKITHHCPSNGWCGVAPATSPFSASDTHWNPGLVVGGGLQFRTPNWFGQPTYLRLYYEHVFVRDFDIFTGNPSVRSINGTLDQDIDRFAVGLVFGSDARLKTDIVPLGKRAGGIALYRYRYLWSGVEHVGVMAQDVAAIRPDAVLQGADGFLRVDYGKLGTRLMTFDEWSRQSVASAAE